ncbi:MAG TPA: hypothetical protein DCE24_04255 [Porphyromonadaceae bacterium]|nr:hypothetical protein [Porphyromonadaceae bacterium]
MFKHLSQEAFCRVISVAAVPQESETVEIVISDAVYGGNFSVDLSNFVLKIDVGYESVVGVISR